LARKSLDSLGTGDFEVLVYFDFDDPQRHEYRLPNVRATEGARYGYDNLHKYYNVLAAQARGQWLMLWNDDAIMTTENWADIIHAPDHTIPQVLTVFHPVNNLFPIISRPFYETLGHFSLNTHADSWAQQVGERSGTQKYIEGVTIIHDKPED